MTVEIFQDQYPWKSVADLAGAEPATSWSSVGHTSNWAIEAVLPSLSTYNKGTNNTFPWRIKKKYLSLYSSHLNANPF